MIEGAHLRALARGAVAALVVALGAFAAPGPVAAQQTPPGAAPAPNKPTPCQLVQQPTTRLSTDSLPGVGQVIYVGGGVIIKCPSREITLKGDSAQQYADHDQMIGNASYDEPRVHVTADFLNYFSADERVTAAGNVHARLPSGSTLVGPQAEWLRAAPRIRAQSRMRAIARPTITIVERDSVGNPSPPMTVIADSVQVDNDSLVSGSGQVQINRPNLEATGDSAFIDQGAETMRLMKKPMVKGNKDRPFTLTGGVVDLFSKNRKLQRVLSRPNAVAVSDSMTLKADTIDLRVHDDRLDHAYAWSGDSAHAGNRARVISPSQNLTADSLDVSMPNQQLQLVHAVRRALAEAKPDTTHFRVDKPDTLDWLQGDTIVAHFDTVPARDTTKNPAIKQLVALGDASSLFHMAPSDSSIHRPAINHVVARNITIDFDEQHKVSTVTTVDSVQGIYLEPQPDSTARKAKADSSRARRKAPAKGASTAKPPAKPPASTAPIPKPPGDVTPLDALDRARP